MKKPFNKYFIILVLGTLLWIGETAAFGFNKTPESGLEGLLDVLASGMIIYGLVGDMMQNVRITKSYHNVTTNRINTKNVQFDKGQKVTTKQTVNVINPPKGKK